MGDDERGGSCAFTRKMLLACYDESVYVIMAKNISAVGEKSRKAFFIFVHMYAANEAAKDSIVVHVVVLVVSCLVSFSQPQKKTKKRQIAAIKYKRRADKTMVQFSI